MKSPPELWAEVSDPESLARHLGAFGEIRITRTEPETTVAWEGDRASGTVELAPAGWGTKVTVKAQPTASEPVAEPGPEPEPEPEPAPEARRRFFARFRRRRPPVAAPEEKVEPLREELGKVELDPEPDLEPGGVLTEMLDTLGTARHRPFTR